MFETMLLCVNCTPFGNPVVPLEYGRNATSVTDTASSKSAVLSVNSEKFIAPEGVDWLC